MNGRADELPIDDIRGVVDHMFSTAPFELRFSALYVFGSFGANEATDSSDVDVLIAVPDETPDDVIEDATALFRHASPMPTSRSLDVVVKRERTANEYLHRACAQRDYETVFDIHTRSYVSTEKL